MSRISDRIRAYVNDPDVSDHYGEWGILRPDQRRKIRELCDTCDNFEKDIEKLMQLNVQMCEAGGKLLRERKTIREKAIKEFAERLCDGRVSNDPVVIAVRAELKMMEERKNEKV